MTEGTSQGLFIVVAIVIFGIFVSLSYTLFGKEGLTNDLTSLFDNAIETSMNNKDLVYTWKKELHAFGKFIGRDPINTVPKFENNVGHGEFLSYTDLSDVFNTNGVGLYQLSFDIKASKPGKIRVYAQNGREYRYQWNYQYVNATSEYQRIDMTIDVKLSDENVEKTMLAFYGTYGTEVLPSVRNVQLYKITTKQ